VTAIVRLDKSFSYRGAPERWSNKYHLTGANPGSNAEWDAILAALTTAEKPLYPSTTTIVYASCYISDTGAAVYTKDYTLTTAEKPLYPSTTTIVYASCYISDTGAAVYTKDYTLTTPIPGTYPGTGAAMAGDQAAWVRWWAGQTNTRGKLIYLRKYFHGGSVGTSGGDSLHPTYKTALTTFGALMVSGLTITGYSGRSMADKAGHAAQNSVVPTYVTTRTLKRRSNSPL
jgi:hypothetical protein